MNPATELAPQLKQLRLSGILDSLDARNRQAIDAKLATNPKLGDAEMARVKQLRSEGEAAHKAGKHDESVKVLNEALQLLDASN